MRWKALSMVVGILLVGFTAGSAFSTNLKIPARVSALEVGHVTMQADIATAVAGSEEDRCLLKRVLCRLDGRSANSCDLKYAVRRGVCTD